MDEEYYSWVRRTKFSHTVCHRIDSSKLPTIPTPIRPLRQNYGKNVNPTVNSPSNSIAANSKQVANSKPTTSSSKSPNRFSYSGSRRERRSKEERALSPLPTTVVSDVFREARSETKRFSTPLPRRNDYERSFTGKLFSKNSSSRSVVDKSKSQKESGWPRCRLDHGGGRVTAVETMEEWKGDLSQLYLSYKFASGAHSKVYHGVYKQSPVAVKVITQPDDDENAILAAKLEKQFTREVTHLSHFNHRNVIKVFSI